MNEMEYEINTHFVHGMQEALALKNIS